MTATQTRDRLAAIRRRQRDPRPDPVQLRQDVDFLMGLVERQAKDLAAARALLLDLCQLTRDANATLAAVKVVAGRAATDPSLNGRVDS